VLGRETAAQHIVGVGHDLHAESAQICVQIARREEQPLSRFQRQPIEQQRGQHPGVARIGFSEFERGPRLGNELPVALAGQIAHTTVEHLG